MLPCKPQCPAAYVVICHGACRDSIKAGKEWFMASSSQAPGLAACLARHQTGLDSYDKQLHVLFLANDVLLKRWMQLVPLGCEPVSCGTLP